MAKTKKPNPAKPSDNIDRPIVDGKIYPRIGIAFGSGATKAVCQFGIIKKLQAANIPISFITGSSMGAIVGGVFALGLDVDRVLEKALRYGEASNINNLSNFNILHESIYKKEYTENLLKDIFADFAFEECKIPLVVASVDLESGKVIPLSTGPLIPAIRASTSIPGIFEPVFLDNHYLVDGGLLEDCPVSLLRQISKCDILIGCSIKDQKARQNISAYIYNKFYSHKTKTNYFQEKFNNIRTDVQLLGAIILRSVDILRDELWDYKLKDAHPDLMINLDIEKVELFDFKKLKDLVKVGEKAFDDNYEVLKAIIESKKKELNE